MQRFQFAWNLTHEKWFRTQGLGSKERQPASWKKCILHLVYIVDYETKYFSIYPEIGITYTHYNTCNTYTHTRLLRNIPCGSGVKEKLVEIREWGAIIVQDQIGTSICMDGENTCFASEEPRLLVQTDRHIRADVVECNCLILVVVRSRNAWKFVRTRKGFSTPQYELEHLWILIIVEGCRYL